MNNCQYNSEKNDNVVNTPEQFEKEDRGTWRCYDYNCCNSDVIPVQEPHVQEPHVQELPVQESPVQKSPVQELPVQCSNKTVAQSGVLHHPVIRLYRPPLYYHYNLVPVVYTVPVYTMPVYTVSLYTVPVYLL